MENKKWLPHFTNEMMIGARGNNLCSYLIALEGWRRGLTLKFYSRLVKRTGVHAPGRLFSLSSETKTHYFYKAKGDDVSSEAIEIGRDKDLTKKLLNKNGIPVPLGKRFLEATTNEEILDYAEKLGYPVVLKPTFGDQGIGVIANIKTASHLKEALLHVRQNFTDIVLERYIYGEEFRVYVLEDNVLAALKRIPANVKGDGIHTIRKLIEMKNRKRKQNPRLYTCLIKVDSDLKNHAKIAGFSLDSIPAKDERVFLRENSNVSTGGDSIDVTDELPVEIKKIAVKALKVMPEIAHAGIDIIVNPDLPLKKAGFVIEINTVPQIGSLVFPMIGQARDIPKALIDYYFPETKDKENYNSKVYFDFKGVLQPLRSKIASDITVSPPPLTPLYAKKYVVSGKVQNVGYRRWIRKKALEANLHGYVQNKNDGTVALVVAGAEKQVDIFKATCEIGSRNSSVTKVEERIWKKPIKVGFEIKANPKIKKRRKTSKTNVPKKITVIQKTKRLLRHILKNR